MHICNIYIRHRGIGTEYMGTILRFASVPLRKIGTRFLGPDSVFYLLDLDLAVEI